MIYYIYVGIGFVGLLAAPAGLAQVPAVAG
jgi:hypothetical protein